MENLVNVCPNCNGTGGVPIVSGFIGAGDLAEQISTCKECNGIGFLFPTFFAEFTFKNYYNTYWLPIFINAENMEEASKILTATKKGLEEKFKEVNHGRLIPKIKNITTSIIQSKFDSKRSYKLNKLNVNVWSFNDIENNPELSFNEHIDFIAYNLPLNPREIAERINAYEFPVRIIKSDFKLEFEDYLLIDIVAV